MLRCVLGTEMLPLTSMVAIPTLCPAASRCNRGAVHDRSSVISACAGDIQLINNHTILHARTAFTDWDDPEKRRHLFRIWLCPPVGRPPSPDWAEQASKP